MSPQHAPHKHTPHTKRVKVPTKIRPGARRDDATGAALNCLVLVTGADEWVGVDLASGALVRNDVSIGHGTASLFSSAPFDVVRLTLAERNGSFDPARPEAIAITDAPVALRRLRKGRTRRLLRRLCAPEQARTPVLGLHGPSVAYVDLDGSTPSVVIVRVSPRRLEFARRADDAVVCSLSWAETKRTLPVIDPAVCAATRAAPKPLRGGAAIGDALGYVPGFLVIGLGAPFKGHAPRQVLAVLAR